MTSSFAVILGYVALQLVIAWLVSRRIAGEDDYLVAGRSFGPVLCTFSIFATWFGAETCVAAAAATYEGGLSAASGDPFGYALCLLILGAVFARALWNRKLSTFADLYRQRYGPNTERLFAILLIPMSLFWAAAQIRAMGQVLSANSDLGVFAAMTFAAAGGRGWADDDCAKSGYCRGGSAGGHRARGGGWSSVRLGAGPQLRHRPFEYFVRDK